MSKIIECENITHYYGNRLIYENLSFDVEQGKVSVRLVPYAAVGYEREITPALSGYVRGEVTYARAFTTTMAGKDFVQPVIKVGVKF